MKRPCRLLNIVRKGLRFGIATVAAFVIHLVVNVGGHELLGISSNVLYPISLVLISLSTFLFCRFFVYPEGREKSMAVQGWWFIVSSVLFRLLEWGCFAFLLNIVGLWYVVCIVIVQVTGTLSKFFFYNFFIFGGRKFSR